MRLYQIGNPDNPRSNKYLQIYLLNHRFELELPAYTQKTLKGAYRRFLRAFQQAVADNVIPATIAKEALEWIAPYPDGELVEFLPKNSDERRKLEQSGETLFIGDIIDPVKGHLASFDFDDNTDCDNGFFIWFILTLDPDKPETSYIESPDSVVSEQNQGIREVKLKNVFQFEEECTMDKVPEISRAEYNTILLHAEKISNGQYDFVPVLRRELREKLNINDVESLVVDLMTNSDIEFLNRVRLFLSQFPFVVVGDDGLRYQLIKRGNFCELDLLEQPAQLSVDDTPTLFENEKSDADVCFEDKSKSYSVYTEEEYNTLDTNAPVKFNHVDIVIQSNGIIGIDGHFDCRHIETAYRRFCKIMQSIDADKYPVLAGWDFMPAKKITCVTDDFGVKNWVNETNDFLFGDSEKNQPADNYLVVDCGEDQYYFFGYFNLYSETQQRSAEITPSVNGKFNNVICEKNFSSCSVDDNNDAESIVMPVEDFQKESIASMEISTDSTTSEYIAVELITLESRAERIRQLQADVQRSIIEIGFELIEAKKQIGHGGWADWLEKEFNWGDSQARYLMNVAKRFGNRNTYSDFGISKLKAMLALPEGDEDAFIEAQAEAGKPIDKQSAREVKASIKQWKQAKSKKISPTVDNEIKLFADKDRVSEHNQPVNENELDIGLESSSAPIQTSDSTEATHSISHLEEETYTDINRDTHSDLQVLNRDTYHDLNSSPTDEMLNLSNDAKLTESISCEKNFQSDTLTATVSDKNDDDELTLKRTDTQRLLDKIATLIQTATNTELDDTIQTLNSLCNILSEKNFRG